MTRHWTRFLLAVLCLLPLAFNAVAMEAAAQEDVLRRGNFLEPESLDPHRARGAEAANILRDLYEGLTREGPRGKILPGTAQRWTISEDGRTYTFYIRENARWSNGDPVTAADYAAGLRRSLSPATGSPYAQSLTIINNARRILAGEAPPETLGVKAVDARVLEITLDTPAPYLLGLLAHHSSYPVHAPSLEKHGEKFTRPGNLVSNGAYRLKDWQVNAHIRLERNPHYWDADEVRIETVYYLPIDDEEAEFNRFRAGEIDVTQTIPVGRYDWLKKEMPDALRIAPYLSTYFYGFNLAKPPFKDAPGLRRALALVVDRELIAEKVLGRGELPAWSMTPPGIDHYESPRPDYADWPIQKRIQEAQRLYRDAGYSREKPLNIELRFNTGDTHRHVAIAVASLWQEHLGVKTELVQEEWRVFLQNRRQREVTQVFRAGWVGDYNDPQTFLQLLQSGSGVNDYGYANPEYDALLRAAAETADPEKRMQLFHDAEALMLAEHPLLPLYVYVSKHLVQPRVGGWEDNLLDHHASRDLFIRK
ncbi:MAG TPA: peptide ABC transporter substrate-binding protein [Gammaproteobacteria bacterium]